MVGPAYCYGGWAVFSIHNHPPNPIQMDALQARYKEGLWELEILPKEIKIKWRTQIRWIRLFYLGSHPRQIKFCENYMSLSMHCMCIWVDGLHIDQIVVQSLLIMLVSFLIKIDFESKLRVRFVLFICICFKNLYFWKHIF